MLGDELDLEALQVQAACSYYLQLSPLKRSNGRNMIVTNFWLKLSLTEMIMKLGLETLSI